MPALLLFLAWLAYGVWAVGIKKAGDTVGLQWTYIVEVMVFSAQLPLDLWILRRADWAARPAWTSLLWVVCVVAAGFAGQLMTIQAAPKFSANTLTLLMATYPVAAMAIFWMMGTRPTPMQLLGTVAVLVGVGLVCLGER